MRNNYEFFFQKNVVFQIFVVTLCQNSVSTKEMESFVCCLMGHN